MILDDGSTQFTREIISSFMLFFAGVFMGLDMTKPVFRLVCIFVVPKLPKTGFLALRPIYCHRTVNYKLIFCFG